MKRILLVVVVVLVTNMFGVGVSAPTLAQAQGMSEGCVGANDAFFDDTYLTAGWLIQEEFFAGETLVITAGTPDSGTFETDIALLVGATTVASTPYPGTIMYTFPADILDYVSWELVGVTSGYVTWDVSCTGAPASGEPAPVPVAVPGCDVTINLPSNAVVGAFMADAPLYYAPGDLVEPYTTLEAGKTAWVLGKDASGGYNKIVWGCQYLWVPASSMGPNYDAVWNGTPLPTGVVE